MNITPEKLDEIERGLDGVTPGPWHIHPVDDTTIITLERTAVATTCDSAETEREDSYNVEYERMECDALHIARLDPSTVQELVRLARIGEAHERAGQYFDIAVLECPACRGDTRKCATTPTQHCRRT